MDTARTVCARHPDTETRLSCTACGTPVCPRCAVDAPVGQKCPACGAQDRATVRRGKPAQYRKGVAFGLLAAAAAGAVLPLALGIRFAGLIATGFLGYGIAHAVLVGSERNRADTFRNLAVGLAVAAVAGGFLVRYGTPLPGGLRGILIYLAAAYGAYARFNR